MIDDLKNIIREELSKQDVQKIIDNSLDTFIRSNKFDKKVLDLVNTKLKIKGNSKNEKQVVDITKDIITKLYRTLYVRRNLWKNSI